MLETAMENQTAQCLSTHNGPWTKIVHNDCTRETNDVDDLRRLTEVLETSGGRSIEGIVDNLHQLQTID